MVSCEFVLGILSPERILSKIIEIIFHGVTNDSYRSEGCAGSNFHQELSHSLFVVDRSIFRGLIARSDFLFRENFQDCH